jgi:hypothetical protein
LPETEGGDLAVAHDSQKVDSSDYARAMRNDDRYPTAFAYRCDRSIQRPLAFSVEIGVGLVEHDEERGAEEGTRQS